MKISVTKTRFMVLVTKGFGPAFGVSTAFSVLITLFFSVNITKSNIQIWTIDEKSGDKNSFHGFVINCL